MRPNDTAGGVARVNSAPLRPKDTPRSPDRPAPAPQPPAHVLGHPRCVEHCVDVEPGTAGIEPGADSVTGGEEGDPTDAAPELHVPIKKKGTRKR